MRRVELLLVEDDDADAELLERAIRASLPDCAVRRVVTAAEFTAALASPTDVVVCDYTLPGWDARGALAQLRLLHGDLPFLVVSGSVGEEVVAECLTAGAADYVMKSSLRRLGAAVVRALDVAALAANERAARAELRRLAWADPLTGMLNRNGIEASLDHLYSEHHTVAIALVRVDRYPELHRLLGSRRVDGLVAALARRAELRAHPGLLLGRLAEGDFVVAEAGASEVAEDTFAVRAGALFAGEIVADGAQVVIQTRVGVVWGRAGAGAAASLRQAELALSCAAHAGAAWSRFDADNAARFERRANLALELPAALARGELTLDGGPGVRLDGRGGLGPTFDLAWNHPSRGPVHAPQLFEIAETLGLVVPLVEWALSALQGQLNAGDVGGAPTILRLPGAALVEAPLAALVADSRIHVEVPESTFHGEDSRALAAVSELAERGVRVIAGGVGAAPAAFTRIAGAGLRAVALERVWFEGGAGPERTRGGTPAMVGFAHTLGLEVIADGVGSALELDTARQSGCDFARGPQVAASQLFAAPG